MRSERTKQLIIEAYLALAQREFTAVPTAAEIAHRAGYSVRSVFERFPDIHALQVAAVDYAMVQVAALAPARDGDGERQTRIRTQVETRGAQLRALAAAVAIAGRKPGRIRGAQAADRSRT